MEIEWSAMKPLLAALPGIHGMTLIRRNLGPRSGLFC